MAKGCFGGPRHNLGVCLVGSRLFALALQEGVASPTAWLVLGAISTSAPETMDDFQGAGWALGFSVWAHLQT